MDLMKLTNDGVVYPYTVGDLYQDNPYVSFAITETGEIALSETDLLDFGVVVVRQAQSLPTVVPWKERLIEINPILVEGIWYKNYEVSQVPEADLQMDRDQLIDRVKYLRDRRAELGGFFVNGSWYHSDNASRLKQIGLVIMGQNMPNNLMWKRMDGSFVQMTPELAMAIFTTAAQSEFVLFAYAEQLISEIRNSDNPYNIDLASGWPATYSNLPL